MKNLPTQCDVPVTADPFADLSLDDIRNNIELFDTEVLVRGDLESNPDCRQILSDEHEARLADIAIPFGAQLLNQYADSTKQHNETVLGYVTTMLVADVASFYIEQMERLGWSCASHIRGYEQLLLFERPERSCSVVIRTVSHPTDVDSSFTKIVIFLRGRV